MRRHIAIVVGLGLLLALLPSARATGSGPEGALAAAPLAAPLGTGITYQGFLKQNGVPGNGTFGMQFQLFDAMTGGTQIGPTLSLSVPVTNGQFTVALDFGASAFNGEARWLAITVQGTPLSPRQEVRAAPYALFAPTAGTAASATSATTATNFTGSLAGDVTGPQGATVVGQVGGQPAASVASGVVAANGATATSTANTLVRRDASGNFAAGTITANLTGNVTGTASGNWSRTGDSATAGEFLGTTNNTALELRVNNAGALRLEPNGTSPNVIGGFSGNSVTAGVVGATISGGGMGVPAPGGIGPNRVTDDYGTVGGGQFNRAGNDTGATGDAAFATVGGGFGNWASGTRATVGGGILNRASGDSATVGGGSSNTASGNYSFAAGTQARALGDGTFVWNDSNSFGTPFASDTNLSSFGSVSTTNSFHVRATGGARFVTNTNNNSGPYVNPGGTAWNAGSHSSLKTDFAAVDPRAVLEGLAGLPLTTWRLRDGEPGVRHLGPMAEDFYAAFGLGDGDRAINTLDADGVAFAAIQGLYSLVQEQAALLAALQAEHAALAARLAAVEQAVAAGEAP